MLYDGFDSLRSRRRRRSERHRVRLILPHTRTHQTTAHISNKVRVVRRQCGGWTLGAGWLSTAVTDHIEPPNPNDQILLVPQHTHARAHRISSDNYGK